jgi:hypothetical protein
MREDEIRLNKTRLDKTTEYKKIKDNAFAASAAGSKDSPAEGNDKNKIGPPAPDANPVKLTELDRLKAEALQVFGTEQVVRMNELLSLNGSDISAGMDLVRHAEGVPDATRWKALFNALIDARFARWQAAHPNESGDKMKRLDANELTYNDVAMRAQRVFGHKFGRRAADLVEATGDDLHAALNIVEAANKLAEYLRAGFLDREMQKARENRGARA